MLIFDAFDIDKRKIDTDNHCLIVQIYGHFVASEVKLKLLEYYPHDLNIALIRGAGIDGLEEVHRIPLMDLDRVDGIDHLTCLYVPPVPLHNKIKYNLKDLKK